MTFTTFFGFIIFFSAISTFVCKIEPYLTGLFRILMNIPIPYAAITSHVVLWFLPRLEEITQGVVVSLEYLSLWVTPIKEAVLPILNSTATILNAYEKIYVPRCRDMISSIDPCVLPVGIMLFNICLLIKYCYLYTQGVRTKNPKPRPFEPKTSNAESYPLTWTKFSGHECIRKIDVNWQLNDYIDSHHHVLVLFFVPWCEYCNTLLPYFAETAEILDSLDSNTKLVAANCDTNSLISQVHGVDSFPTMKYYRLGRFVMDVEDNERFNLVNFLIQVTQN